MNYIVGRIRLIDPAITKGVNMPNKNGTGPKGQGSKDGHGKGKGHGAGKGPMSGGKKGIKEKPKK